MRRSSSKLVPVTLAIAASDSSGGAGVQADLKTFAAIGVYGASVLTAITIQDTTRVYEVRALPADLVERQLRVVLDDLAIDAVKVGVLYSPEVVETVASVLKKQKLPIVLDPVLKAGSGDSLIQEEAKQGLVEELFPLSTIVTPNLMELEEISKVSVGSLEDLENAARSLIELGAYAVIAKGFEYESRKLVDLLCWPGGRKEYRKSRLPIEPHGAGWSFSSAIAAFLAKGLELVKAVDRAEAFIERALASCLEVGKGRRPVDPLAREVEREAILDQVRVAAAQLARQPEVSSFIAEVGTQIAMAATHAASPADIAALDGKIAMEEGRLRVGEPAFGCSTHMASVILMAMRFDPDVRSALNVRYDERLLEAFRSLGYAISSFDRREEPPEVKTIEGRSLAWGTEQAILRNDGKVPDIIYDLGELGREPMIRVLGRSASEAVGKLLSALAAMRSRRSWRRESLACLAGCGSGRASPLRW